MSKIILQINYKFTSSPSEHVAMMTPMAKVFADVTGLLWKIWLMDEVNHEAGGIYLFETHDAAQAFMNGSIVSDFVIQPSIRDVSAKMFETDEGLGRITRAPLV